MSGAGASGDEARARLAAELSAAAAAGAPVAAVAADGRTLLWATPAGRAMLGVRAGEDLPALLDAARVPVERLAELARALPPGGPPRLERLRLPGGRLAATVTLACRSVALDPARPFLLLVGAAPRGGAGHPVPDVGPLLAPAETAGQGSAEPSADALVARAGGRPFLRFIWQMDAAGRFTTVTPPLYDAVGAVSPEPGDDWAALLARGVRDEEDAVARALQAGRTFTGLDVLWPLAGGAHAVPVALSGVPVLGPDRAILGYRGFGLMRLTALLPLAEPVDESHADSAGPHVEASPDIDEPLDDVADMRADERPEDVAAPPSTVVPFTQRGPSRPAADAKVVPLRAAAPARPPADSRSGLSRSERHAFREIARALGARIEGDDEEPGEPVQEALQEAPREAGRFASEAPSPPLGTNPPEASASPVVPPEVEAALEAAAQAEARAVRHERGTSAADIADASPAAEQAEPEAQLVPAADPAAEAVAVMDEAAQAEAAGGSPAPPDAAQPEPVSPPAPEPEPLSEVARHADTLFDRVPVGLLVCRGEVPIVMNRTLLDLIGWDSIDAFYRDGGLARLFRGRTAEAIPAGQDGSTVALATREGEIVAVDARIQTIPWDGLPATLMTFRRAVDVELTPRLKAAELELRRREAQERELRAILDTATDGVIVLDEDGRILSINRSGEALFGYDQREVAGETFISLLAPDSHATALDYLEGLKSNGVASVLNDGREVVGRVRQGGRIPLFMTLGAVSREPEVRFCAVLRDITPWKKAESDLTEAKRAAEEASSQKSDFLAKISHEIRTPLSAIIGFAEVMIEERFGPVGNERYLEYLRDIHASGGHVISLVNDLLDLSKIEAGRFDSPSSAST